MTIDEAIKELEYYVLHSGDYRGNFRKDSLQLGIEALKRLKSLSPYPHEYTGGPLPGETEK